MVHPLSLAVWYMDDGYYYKRDKIAYIYLSNYFEQELDRLMSTLHANFGLIPDLKKKSKGLCFTFSVKATLKLVEIVEPFVVSTMRYKLPFDPVSTESARTK